MFEATLFTILAIIVISISTQAYNLVIGYAGMMHLGHIGFYAIGAYTAAILSTELGTPFLGTLIMSFLIAAIAGFLIGIPTIRLRGDYLTIGTLGFSEVIRLIITNWYSVTGGALGIDKIPDPAIAGFTFHTTTEKVALYIVIAAILHFIMWKIIHSPYGKVIESIREDEKAAQALGKNVVRHKLEILTISAGIAGVAGAMYAHGYYNYINPTVFQVNEMVFILLYIIIGGMGTFWGAIIGPIIAQLIFEIIRMVGNGTFAGFELNIGAVRQMLYALIFMIIIIMRPQGIMGKIKKRKHGT
jgi:branched-chain amino acid transport system permease protein